MVHGPADRTRLSCSKSAPQKPRNLHRALRHKFAQLLFHPRQLVARGFKCPPRLIHLTQKQSLLFLKLPRRSILRQSRLSHSLRPRNYNQQFFIILILRKILMPGFNSFVQLLQVPRKRFYLLFSLANLGFFGIQPPLGRCRLFFCISNLNIKFANFFPNFLFICERFFLIFELFFQIFSVFNGFFAFFCRIFY